MSTKKTSFVIFALGLFPALASLQLLGLAITIPEILRKLMGNTFNLSQQLSVDDATAILSCLNQSSVVPQDSPYYKTDVWLQRKNYTVSNYTITTQDGYILKVFRITSSPKYSGSKKASVFVNHGLAGTSNQWLVQEGQNNLPTVLADQGYDVWIGNCRGNSFSDKHVNLTVNNRTYWDFSFHEMGIYNVPAVIDRMLNETGRPQIYYIGYSMGTTQYMILLSERPEYNQKIKAGFLLAPAAIVNESTTVLATGINLLELSYYQKYLTDPILGGKINTNDALQKYSGHNAGELCSVTSLANCAVCNNVMFAIFGFDTVEMNYTALPSFYTNYADVIGTKCVVHYAQLTKDPEGRFKQFDYGPTENMMRYNNVTPPEYKLFNITAPTYMYYGRGDNLCPPKNVETLRSKFTPGVIKEFNLIDPTNNGSKFNHLDFVVGIHDNEFFISKIVNSMNADIAASG